jgi:hypothetical protein
MVRRVISFDAVKHLVLCRIERRGSVRNFVCER